jgi:hypothetical protein
MLQSTQRVLDQVECFLRSPVNGLVQSRGMMGNRKGLVAFETGFDHAAYVVITVLPIAVLIAQVNIDMGDAIADFAQRILYNAPDLIRQGCVTFDIVIRMDLDLHGGFLLLSVVTLIGSSLVRAFT